MNEDTNEIGIRDDESMKERVEAAATIIHRLRGMGKPSGMAEELQRERRAEDDAWNRKVGFPITVWKDWSKSED